ncbi:MAG: hypothetical protein LBD14_06705, partial [Puniceicoccales bacterium]|nr:hypothetical protein [Puniceicoccales bacterium]
MTTPSVPFFTDSPVAIDPSSPCPSSLRAVRPQKQGLYDPAFEHDACGVGFVVDVKGRASHEIVRQGLHVLERLDHRG